ncbi:hypothetical protein [Streptomyces cinereoruber]|uniref:hypothetical protein n=1 Tax=Streptomyces cinereoruber TaxID=67260 RepID=UPI00363D3974
MSDPLDTTPCNRPSASSTNGTLASFRGRAGGTTRAALDLSQTGNDLSHARRRGCSHLIGGTSTNLSPATDNGFGGGGPPDRGRFYVWRVKPGGWVGSWTRPRDTCGAGPRRGGTFRSEDTHACTSGSDLPGRGGFAAGSGRAAQADAVGDVVVFSTEAQALDVYGDPSGRHRLPAVAHVLTNRTDKPVRIYGNPFCLGPSVAVQPGYGTHVPGGAGSFSA